MTKTLLILPVALLLSGCFGTFGNKGTVEKISVPIPVPCNIIAPIKPVMPLDSIEKTETDISIWTKAALAEIELRKGYELELETAITSCNQNERSKSV